MDSDLIVPVLDPGGDRFPPATAVPPTSNGSGPASTTLPREQAWVLTLFTLYRRPVFRDPRAARAVSLLQARTLPRERAEWLAWVLMPDCWQGLLVCDRGQSLPALVGRFKAMTTRAVDPRHRINGWLWGRGHRAAPLAADASLGDAARILVTAPRRAGLVATLADYPYWESAWDPETTGTATRTPRRDA